MVRRIIEAFRSDFDSMSAGELLESIALSEARAVMAEVGPEQRHLGGITSAEIAAAFGADLVALNTYDVQHPTVYGLQTTQGDKAVLASLRRMAGVPIGVNLEPSDLSTPVQQKVDLPEGRIASIRNARSAAEQGASFICLTGNPRTGVTNAGIAEALRQLKGSVGGNVILMAGKMHSAGVMKESGRNIVSEDEVNEFASAGCNVMMLPSPGSVPGVNEPTLKRWADKSHDCGMLAMSCLDLAIEGSDFDTIRRIALHSKMAGVDICHIGDAGFNLFPENIMVYSQAIKGRYHTFRRMAASAFR